MKRKPQILDMGVIHFDREFLREMNDPRADDSPDGYSIHVFQCADCGAYTNDGNPDHIKHHATCVAGESERWCKFYSKEATA